MSKLLVISTILLLLTGCEGKDHKPALPPEKSTLVFPNQNETCTAGTVISASQSSILFKWNSSANTESYDLKIKDLITGTITTRTAAGVELEVTLNRNTPYSWYIISKSATTEETAQSDIWKFYNSGPGVISYAPFPAEIIMPLMAGNVNAVNGKITLDWNGNDVDGDITTYDVYFGTSNTPALHTSNLAGSIVADVSVNSNTIYYWKVITKDSKGNTSDSGIYQFKVN